MNVLTISAIVFACTLGGAVATRLLRSRLPDHHLSSDTKEVVKFAAGIIGTMTGILVGWLVSSAKTSFDGQRSGASQLSANVVVLDVRAGRHPVAGDHVCQRRPVPPGATVRCWRR